MECRKAVVVGATSGIGKELAVLLLRDNWQVALAGRRVELLGEIQEQYGDRAIVRYMDVRQPADAIATLLDLIEDLGGMDLLIYSSGVGFINPDLDLEQELETIRVNVTGFTAITGTAIKHFISRGSGHLVGISSIAALMGSEEAPAYNASKAFESNYLQGLRKKIAALKLPIYVTDIQPGLVATNMAKGEGLFWVEPVEKAAGEIYDAIRKKRPHAYVTKRWGMLARLIKVLPV